MTEQARILDAQWDNRSTFTVDETAKILGLSRASAFLAANNGNLPVVRVGNRIIVPRFALEKLLMGCEK